MTAPAVKALTCPSCGAAITLRTGAQALVVVCDSCHAVLDAHDPNLAVLQQLDKRMAWKPLIPLGTRGSLKGEAYEAVGFQVRSITEDGETYRWREYVLWNPYQGYRYLSEYDGHWNDIIVTKTPPTEVPGTSPPMMDFHGERFRHFQTAKATTEFILGEFPWQVRGGDTAVVRDYVSPPHMLSAEATEDETTWSVGTYTEPGRVWEAFKLPGSPPSPTGVFENQPDDYMPRAREYGSIFAVFAILLVLFSVARHATAADRQVFADRFSFMSPGSDSTAVATQLFRIDGRTSNVEVQVHADVSNSWAYFNMSLINEQTGKAIDFGREVDYYYGSDSDGPWSEGSQDDHSFLPAVPAGSYFLRIQPEGPPGAGSVGYTVVLKRDVPRESWFFVALLVLAAVPAFEGLRAWAFEGMRWRESDHPMVSPATPQTGNGDDDGDT